MKGALLAASVVGAHAAVPEHSFHVPTVLAGLASGCRGADTMTVKSTPEALTWNFGDMGAVYPASGNKQRNVNICVMENDIADTPGGWRFRVDNIAYSGSGMFNGGALVEKLTTRVSLNVAYSTSEVGNYSDWKFALNSQDLGEWNLYNVNLAEGGGDLDGDFTLSAKGPELWSPCWSDQSHDPIQTVQMSHQTQLHLGTNDTSSDAQGRIDDDLQLKLNLVWEECDSAANPIAEWGTKANKGDDFKPHPW
ncbi:hypothetical protein F4808DRAFT_454918 [Astrocystis sublimbata]|nr:hypothetical protein F4808DRAFT_454918 [Astrocystis sublimbata]